MNASIIGGLAMWLPAGGWERFAADALWQSTALAGAGLILSLLVRRRAALRAAILLAATLLSVVVPLLSSAVRATGGGLLSRPVEIARVVPSVEPMPLKTEAPAQATMSQALESGSVVSAAEGKAVAPKTWPGLATGVLACVWLMTSVVLAWRLLRGWIGLRRAIRAAEPCIDPAVCAAMLRAAEMLRVRPPELLQSQTFETPALVALVRPRLLVPLEMPEGVDWFAVFCHELAHLARRDGASRLAVEICLILLPWQPLVWLARRQFRSACEEACDDWAVASGADPVELASLLVALVPQLQPTLALGMAESRAATRHRVLRLLSMKGAVHPQLGLALGVIGWVLATGLAVAVAMLQYGGSKPSEPVKPPPAASAPVQSPSSPGPETFTVATDWLSTYPSETQNARTSVNSSTHQAPPWGDEPLSEAIAKAAAALPKAVGRPAPYVIEPPDVLLIDVVKLIPKAPYHIEPLDVLHVDVANPLKDLPINADFPVDPEGMIDLGASYGKVKVVGQTIDEAKTTVESYLKSVLRGPVVSVRLAQTSGQQQIAGEHLVGPDGTVIMGTYGTVYVAGLTVAEAKKAIEENLSNYLEQPRVSLDIFSYNSKVYYVVVQGAGGGDSITRSPITGNDHVLDTLAQADGKIPDLNACWVWVARPGGVILPVDWPAVVEGTDTTSNWKILAGDRIFVRSKRGAGQASSAEMPDEKAAQSDLADLPTKRSSTRDVFAAIDGTVYEVLVDHGDIVKRGQELARLRNTDLENDYLELVGKLMGTRAKVRAAASSGAKDRKRDGGGNSDTELTVLKEEEASYRHQLAILDQKRKDLVIRSPIDGQIDTWRVRELLLSRPVKQGQVLMSVAAPIGDK